MDFSPFNPTVKLCIEGMNREAANQPEEAKAIFLQAFESAGNDFEKFLAAHYVARHQNNAGDTLIWLQKALDYATKSDSIAARTALPALYANMSKCYAELAEQHQFAPSDGGPFYHGTRADLQVGDLLVAGGSSNYKSDFTMNHIYFTALLNGAGLAAALARGDARERVYIVEPQGFYESDPNLTDKKFPGNPSRSYRSTFPLKIVGEATEWPRYSPEEIQKFREKIQQADGKIIN